MKYADIIVDISHEKLDKVYQYIIPNELVSEIVIGSKVNISFGRRFITGYVVGISDKPSFDISKLKYIDSVAKNSIPIESKMICLAHYIRENFGGTMNDALRTVIPVKSSVKNVEKKDVKLTIDRDKLCELIEFNVKKNNVARVRFLKAFEKNDSIDYSILTKNMKVTSSVINYFVNEGVASVIKKTMYRNPIKDMTMEKKEVVLNEEQSIIVDDFVGEYDKGIRNTYLIFGVTGSGKTQVYIEMINHVLRQNKQVIMLIPEIALTYQTVRRFYSRFGDRISILNSRMSQGERYDQYLRAKNGDIDIIIGPRSALFTPFSNLGLIIIDEEHESSYKSETVPKYHAREVAIKLAFDSKASVVLGSATPSLESYYRALKGEIKMYKMTKRAVSSASLPKVYVEDLREELRAGNKSIFSRRLFKLMNDRLEKKEQIMLFINRRGYSGFVSCRSCGAVIKCPHCEVSLTYHKNKKLVCHYCGYSRDVVKNCPECGSDFIALFGTGTQKIEDMVMKYFPKARVLRMDADTTSTKDGHDKILNAFSLGEADILVGTQMIVKGHDFPNVTLVGILAADLSLNMNDYKAAEKTFQLLTQAAGRAGRAEKEGEVVIQTYRPNHYCITTSKSSNYESFFENEIKYRTLAKYPPVSDILLILVTSKKEDDAFCLINMIKDFIDKLYYAAEDCRIYGPSDACLTKANDLYRKVLYIKSREYNLLVELKNKIEGYNKTLEVYSKCNVYFDFNPINTY